ncbi:MAG: phosphatase PAP2 family protein [Clostridia bacterium]
MVTKIGIEIVKAVQSISNGFFDVFFSGVTMLGEEIFIILALVFICFAYDKKFGEYMGYSLLTSLLLNAGVKNIFKADRPFQADSSIINKRPETAGGFSFPSGHTQGATAVFSSAYVYKRKKRLLIVGLIACFLVAISRLYLGVHFPKDVIVGFILSVLVSILCFWVIKKFEKQKLLAFALTGVIFIPMLFFAETKDFFTNFGLYYGFVAGVFVENKFINFENTKVWWKKILRIVIALALVMAVKEGFKLFLPTENWAHLLRYFAISFVGIGVTPLLIKLFKI